jgi:hypothetical protein
MADRKLLAKRINNGQSELWLTTEAEKRRVVATNAVLYPIRTICSPEESKTFHDGLAIGEAEIPVSVTNKLIADFGLGV